MPAPYPSQKSDKFLLRLPDGVRQQVAEAAEANNRTMTKEMVLRLQQSFDTKKELPFSVQEAVAMEMEERGGTFEEALTRLVLVGQAVGGTVVNISIDAGTTVAQVNEMIGAAAKLLPQDASIYLERRK